MEPLHNLTLFTSSHPTKQHNATSPAGHGLTAAASNRWGAAAWVEGGQTSTVMPLGGAWPWWPVHMSGSTAATGIYSFPRDRVLAPD